MSQQVKVYRMLDLSPAALTPFTSRLYPVMRLGDRTTEVNVKMTAAVGAQHLDPVQFNLNITGANPSASSTINTIYQLITHDTTDMSYLRLKCADWNIAIAKNILDAYIYQGEIVITAAAGTTLAISGEVCVSGLVMDAGSTGTAVTGSVVGQIIAMRGSKMPTTSYGLIVRTETAGILNQALRIETNSGTTITNGIWANNAGTFTNLIQVGGTIVNFLNLTGAGNSGFVTSGGTGTTYTLKIITPDGAAGYIRVFAAA